MLYYNEDKLTCEAMDMLYRHFNQFDSLSFFLQNAMLLFDREEEETYQHMMHLKHRLQLLIGNIKITEEKSQLDEIAGIFKSGQQRTTQPGLIELCYASLWSYKCKTCDRWWRDKTAKLQEGGIKVRKASSKLAQNCYRKHIALATARCSSSTSIYAPSDREIHAKNQNLLRKIKMHRCILKFLRSKTYKMTAAQRQALNKNEQQKDVIILCYRFLYNFCHNSDPNKQSISKKPYIKLFISHLQIPWLKYFATKLLTEILEDNEVANHLVNPTAVKRLVSSLFVEQDHEKRNILLLLKNLVECQSGVLKNRQQQVVSIIAKIF